MAYEPPVSRMIWKTGLLLSLCLGFVSLHAVEVGPWDLDELFQVPQSEETDRAAKEGMTGILYESIPVDGKRVQVFAYYGVPEGKAPEGGWPAVVCVHGGGGTAFNEWVAKWNEHGYAAISMDLEGHYPIRQADGENRGPRISTENPGLKRLGIFKNYEDPIEQQWYYHAVAQVILAHSLIRSFPEVNSEKIGITGISWGGTLTSTTMGVDHRFSFAIPVYGCGFLPDSDGNQGIAITPGKYTDVVNKFFDGSAYFENVQMPVFWVNGTNDKHFPMPATQASSRAVQGPTTLRYELRMRHGHYPGWEPAEIYAFADSIVREDPPLVEFGKLSTSGDQAIVLINSKQKVAATNFYYTTSNAPWPERLWEEGRADFSGSTLTATIPAGTTAYYFSATDDRGHMVSSDFALNEY